MKYLWRQYAINQLFHFKFIGDINMYDSLIAQQKILSSVSDHKSLLISHF